MVLGRADVNRAAGPPAIPFVDLTMPRLSITLAGKYVGLTLAELIEEFARLNVPQEVAPHLAATAYFYCPFPSPLQSAWCAAIREVRGLSEVMAKLQCGREGPNHDYSPFFELVEGFLAGTVGAVPRDSMAISDRDGNICALEGSDGSIYAERPDRDRDLFLLLSVEILNHAGKVTKVAAYEMMKDVIYLLEGNRVAPNSVKRQYLRARSRYGRAWTTRRIDLSRLRRVLSQPEGRYVAVWADAVKSPNDASSDAATQASIQSSIQSPLPDGEKLTEKLTKYKPVPKWAGAKGGLAKWMETGEPPTPDKLPLALEASARSRLWRRYDGSTKPPRAPARALRRSSASRKTGAKKKLHRTAR